MDKTHSNALASIEFQLNWQSQYASHKDCFFGPKINFWRDIMPSNLESALMDKTVGEEINVALSKQESIPAYHTNNQSTLKIDYFNRHILRGRRVEPRIGRFYPYKFLQNPPPAIEKYKSPFRCTAIDDKSLQVDFNHPLAPYDINLTAKIHEVRAKHDERGGRCNEWVELVTNNGVGFQTRYQNIPTDFFTDDPFGRLDWSDDTEFYRKPRLVTHIDEQAIALITAFYGQFLQPGMKVLDLMSSWKSHLPVNLSLAEVIGLGMNEEELIQNSQLTGHLIHDLNQSPNLPFASAEFDAVICTVSVEYLTQPLAIFEEVARILKPQGFFLVTFSNRWFPPKVINIWSDLHEFERVGLVMEYFLSSGKYQHLFTYSARNYPRPVDDKHIHETSQSDPVFAVGGLSNC